eukprot:312263-Prymnesium_polylepis.1
MQRALRSVDGGHRLVAAFCSCPRTVSPYACTAVPRRTQRRYRESGLNLQTQIPHLPVMQIQIQGQI